MITELIIPTYNAPRALDLVLRAIALQTRRPDSIAIADDGSGQATRDVLQAHEGTLPLRHVWHPDDGFRKNVILNRAIATSAADLLVFIDGDCLASPGFIARHIAMAAPDRFTTGSVIRLSAETTAAVSAEAVETGRVFDTAWLATHGELNGLSRKLKSGALPDALSAVLDRASPVRKTWSGGNASAPRAQLLRVNGFDETMRYGGEDKELGARLMNAGVRGQFLRYTAPLLHLHHERNYVDPDLVAQNRRKIIDTRRSGRHWAEFGIVHARE